MAKGKITKPSAAAVVYPINHRMSYSGIFIQNKTNGNITVKVSGDDPQNDLPMTFSNPTVSTTYPTSPVVLPAGEALLLDTPCTALEFSGAGVGMINIVESF
jgi:hypothetical protein